MFHMVCVPFFLSPFCSKVVFHCSVLCAPICFVISLLREVIRVSEGFELRRVFLSFMRSLMCVGRG